MSGVPRADAVPCESLLKLVLPRAEIVRAETVPAGQFKAPDDQSYKVHAFCRVHAVARPTPESNINFEVWMPSSGWNGRYHQYGEGNLGGNINYPALSGIVNEGSVAVATDDGHIADKDGIGATWARDKQKIVDSFSLSLKTTFDGAMAVVGRYYDRKSQYRYFSGCSGGGRQAFIAAQRFPQDWDGILAGAPGNDTTRIYSIFAAYGQIWRNNPEGRIPPQKLPAIQQAALASCNSRAQVVNGIATDPRFCKLDPDALACTGEETDSCLTEPQRLMLKTLYGGIVNKTTGKVLYPGFLPTMENAGGWAGWILSASPMSDRPPESIFLGNRFFQNFVYDDPAWDVGQFDVSEDPPFAENKIVLGHTLASIANTNETDLSPLRKAGTKLIEYEGWGDPGIFPADAIDYHRQVVEKAGGAEKTGRFYRLFMVPGMLHCGGGPGANAFGQPFAPGLKNDAEHNIIRALEAWVEKGVTPERVIATKYVDDKPDKGVAFTRPLCPFPQVPRYKGSGSTDLAVNFECVNDGT